MHRYFLSIKAFLVLAAALVAALVAGGCGGGGSASANEVTVQTGSLSKAEFIKRADAICEANRRQFTQEYTVFLRQHKSQFTKAASKSLLGEIVDTIMRPDFGKDIDEISTLGAPSGDEQEVALFLNALQQRLEEIHEQPYILNKTITAFANAEKLARAYGLNGCAGSFS